MQITVEPSKSLCNRYLILHHLLGNNVDELQLSSADDVQVLKSILNGQHGNHWNVGHTGTAFRFLTALACLQNEEIILTGSERIKERPIAPLVDILRKWGAEISYLNKEGFAPLKISSSKLSPTSISLEKLASSQFITALLLIAPFLETELNFQLHPKQGSTSYIKMTLDCLKNTGLNCSYKNNQISIYPVSDTLKVKDFPKIESDWSSASYWYSMVACGIINELELSYFTSESSQGDAVLPRIFNQLGVTTVFQRNQKILLKKSKAVSYFKIDCTECPDIAQTLLITCIIKQIPCEISGLESLVVKECDRYNKMPEELKKLQIKIINDSFCWAYHGEPIQINKKTEIQTHKDHRIALSFAPIQFLYPDIIITNKKVVNKSYPDFWSFFEELKSHQPNLL
ncbi:MAG: 3-phosphoshikimate 1-carboxyvinyltransferase [Flavobacteriales bacterium]|jgi:3-phosphoshikimate 1-carboxyvinyltransferase|nr:3-phosphoshikimate 1-carboxyvinyltransferase [Flavobacteriales bacterium]